MLHRRFLTASLPLAILLSCHSLDAAQRKRPVKRRPVVARPASIDVAASPEVDSRVACEVESARLILDNLTAANLLDSPYLVSAFYYHDGFLDAFPADRNTAAPERRIIGLISKLLTPDAKARFMRLLHELWSQSESQSPQRLTAPVAWRVMSGRRNHRYAVDLFTPEGDRVAAVSRGLIVLAEGNWSNDDLFSTSSRKGGNSIILFDPDHDRFYRYCHLSSVVVSPGDVVAPGQTIGNVGHSGLNASLTGHGRHLHFEANQYSAGHMRAMDYLWLRAAVRNWRGSPTPAEPVRRAKW